MECLVAALPYSHIFFLALVLPELGFRVSQQKQPPHLLHRNIKLFSQNGRGCISSRCIKYFFAQVPQFI